MKSPLMTFIVLISGLLLGQQSYAENSFASRLAVMNVNEALESPVQFERNSARLTAASLQVLDSVAGLMHSEGYQQVIYQIEGHTDMSGGYSLNKMLSQKRATAVKAYLMQKGVQSVRMNAQGFAYDQLLPGKAMNDPIHRRVMFKRIR